MSDDLCDVQLDGWDGETPVFFQSYIHKARKEHQCFKCRETIPVGDRYERTVGKWDGQFACYKFCLSCSEASGEFMGEGRCFGTLWDGMVDAWEQGAHVQACVQRLTTAKAKQHLLRQWRKWKKI